MTRRRTPQPGDGRVSNSAWHLYDGLLLSGKPSLTSAGVHLMDVAYPQEWFPGDRSGFVGATELNTIADAWAALPAGTPCCVDIESWSIDPNGAYITQYQGLEKYVDVSRRLIQRAPSVHFGFFGLMPFNDIDNVKYSQNQDGDAVRKSAQWAANAQMVAVLDQFVRVNFPAAYFFAGATLAQWQESFRQTMTYARGYNSSMPVYPFISPYLADAHTVAISANDWRAILEACWAYADGAVLWSDGLVAWDATAAWWMETQSFMRDRGVV